MANLSLGQSKPLSSLNTALSPFPWHSLLRASPQAPPALPLLLLFPHDSGPTGFLLHSLAFQITSYLGNWSWHGTGAVPESCAVTCSCLTLSLQTSNTPRVSHSRGPVFSRTFLSPSSSSAPLLSLQASAPRICSAQCVSTTPTLGTISQPS